MGAGELLLKAIVAWATARKVRQVVLQVTCGDTSAYRLYVRNGFKPVGPTEPLRPGSSMLSQPMRLVLIDDAA
jgi:ribosomal protein S18 acetylase RimI-like enzyme